MPPNFKRVDWHRPPLNQPLPDRSTPRAVLKPCTVAWLRLERSSVTLGALSSIEAGDRMTSVLVELSLSYAIPSEGRRGGSPSAVNEPCPADPFTAAHQLRSSAPPPVPRHPGALATWPSVSARRRPVGGGIQSGGSDSCATIAWSRSACTPASSTDPHPIVDAWGHAERIYMQMPSRDPGRDACIHCWMPASRTR